MSHRHVTKGASSSLVTDSATQPAIDAAIKAHVAAMHTPIVVPPIPPIPGTGIPAMPAGGDLLAKDFNDGTIVPFRQVFYVDDHPGDFMGVANDYRGAPASVISFPLDGNRKFLRLSCFPKDPAKPAGPWWAVLLSSGADGVGGNPTFTMHTGYLQCATRQSFGYAAWPTAVWLRDDTPPWGGSEIDLREGDENGKAIYNVYPGGNRVAIRNAPADPSKWVISGMALADDHVTFTEDGLVIGRWNGALEDMNLLLDSKAGFPWAGILPDARTPNPILADIAWISVSSKIPAGL